ncbi:hypothetical protein ANO14919_066870 [Xylariales sp. No.14919]|nr:hypothetical protein ANO14919_066870 [Xylariales sp. No.14919]
MTRPVGLSVIGSHLLQFAIPASITNPSASGHPVRLSSIYPGPQSRSDKLACVSTPSWDSSGLLASQVCPLPSSMARLTPLEVEVAPTADLAQAPAQALTLVLALEPDPVLALDLIPDLDLTLVLDRVLILDQVPTLVPALVLAAALDPSSELVLFRRLLLSSSPSLLPLSPRPSQLLFPPSQFLHLPVLVVLVKAALIKAARALVLS